MPAAQDFHIEEGSPLDEWLKWAESYAERVDPLAGLRDERCPTARGL